jgi:hypothetical protein
MTKKVMIAVVVILLIGGAAFAYSRRPTTTSPAALDSQSTSQTESEATEFAKAIESGRPTVCVMTKGDESMEYRIKGKKMRGNITATAPSESSTNPTTVSHMISDEAYFYTWVDGQKQGTKMSLTVPSPTATTVNDSTPNTPDFSDESDYNALRDEGYTINCQAGIVSDADFVPPADVDFQDLSAMIQAIPTPGSNGQIDYQKLQEQYGAITPEDN